MADAADVCGGIQRRPGTRYTALVPNPIGLDRALAARITEISVFAAASEPFSRRNINQSIDDSLAVYRKVVGSALAAGLRARGYVSVAFGCPFQGDVPIEQVLLVTRALLEMGVYEVSVSDTIGIAHPGQVRRVLSALTATIPPDQLALHFHDTRGTALANVLASLDFGIRTFDASAGGLGGCPYAPGATGNLATEDLLYLLHGLGHETGVSIDAVRAASTRMEPHVGHPVASRYVRATVSQRSP
jgi:hydroxymethylglutaryl-CoA lyase